MDLDEKWSLIHERKENQPKGLLLAWSKLHWGFLVQSSTRNVKFLKRLPDYMFGDIYSFTAIEFCYKDCNKFWNLTNKVCYCCKIGDIKNYKITKWETREKKKYNYQKAGKMKKKNIFFILIILFTHFIPCFNSKDWGMLNG